ncbi:MAG: hypothetical protein ABR608_03545 [Pseudonocardiaceae bacterium]
MTPVPELLQQIPEIDDGLKGNFRCFRRQRRGGVEEVELPPAQLLREISEAAITQDERCLVVRFGGQRDPGIVRAGG